MADMIRNSLTSAVCYRDAKAALDWLEKAFGFELAMLVTDDKGEIGHSEMRFGESLIMIGNEWDENTRSPASLGGKTTQTVHVHLKEDIDKHCERARKAGAEILMEPADQFYGDRTYRARDPEGHIWTFGQTVRDMSPEEMSDGSGFKVKVFP
ncbi:MAG: VOC family protein [Pseudomonadota bacterium]|nr:VOC family protein [Pseudomonadota bacterium]